MKFMRGFVAVSLCFVGLFGSVLYGAESQILSQYQVVEPSDQVMQEVAHRFEIVSRAGRRFDVIVPAARAQEFLALVPQAKLVRSDIKDELRFYYEDSEYRAGYHSYEEVVALMRDLEAKHPELVKVETYGKSREGRDLYVLKLSDNVAQDEAGEARLMIDAATHGDEIITTEVVLNLLQELLNGYGSDSRLTAMVNQTALYFVPMVSPDGFANQDRYAEGVDPNRSYPYPLDPERQPITVIQAIMDLAAKHRFAGAMDFHAYGGMIMYPWAYTGDPIADETARGEFHALAQSMAAQNHWDYGPIAEVIYQAPGSSADYYFWKFGTKAIAIEVGSSKAPPSSQIPRYVADAREMTWRFIESFAPRGAH